MKRLFNIVLCSFCYVIACAASSHSHLPLPGAEQIPVQGPEFFQIQDGGDQIAPQKQMPANAPTADTPWDVTSTVETCFDPKNIGEKAWLMTADGATQLKVTLSYTGADSRYTIAAHSIKFYWYEGSDLFHDDAKELITDTETFVGDYTSSNNEKEASVTITAPSKYPFTSGAYYSYYVVIKVKFQNGGTASVAKNVGVSRPGVLILHGLNDSSETFQTMREHLLEYNTFIPSQVITKDYSGTNTSSFYENTHTNQVVKIALNELSNQLFDAGIASTKYDMVGHSMGGILERLYTQEVDNEHTHKLITLNTPHFGAPLGNVAPALFDLIDTLPITPETTLIKSLVNTNFNPAGGRAAVADLAIGSPAIANLNSASALLLSGIPVYAVGTYIDPEYGYVAADIITSGMIIDEVTYLLAHLFYEEVPGNKYSYLFDDNVWGDGIVSITSQQGGLPSDHYTMMVGPFGLPGTGGAFHCFSPRWSSSMQEIKRLLLLDPDDSAFSFTGFGTSESSRTDSKRVSADNFITSFAEPRPESNIHIQAALDDTDSNNINVSLSHSDDMMTTMAFGFVSKDRMIAHYDFDKATFRMDADLDSLKLYAIGRTNYNALVVDSVTVRRADDSGIIGVPDRSAVISWQIQSNNLVINHEAEVSAVEIYDIAGHLLRRYNRAESGRYPLPPVKGVLIAKITSANTVKSIKLIK